MHECKRVIQISVPSTGEEEWHACREPLMTGWLTQGPQVASFEQAFATRHGVRHALAVTSCTTGLHLALAGARHRVGRRSDRAGLHLGGDRQRRALLRCDPGVCRRRSQHATTSTWIRWQRRSRHAPARSLQCTCSDCVST